MEQLLKSIHKHNNNAHTYRSILKGKDRSVIPLFVSEPANMAFRFYLEGNLGLEPISVRKCVDIFVNSKRELGSTSNYIRIETSLDVGF
eukprot:716672-Amorphochlora_amoeboformis.AAC.3